MVLWQSQLKKKEITNTLNTFFIKSHQEGMGHVIFASCPERATGHRRNSRQKSKIQTHQIVNITNSILPAQN